MGFLDGLLGRSKPAKANLDVLFAVPQAALTLQAEGFAFSGHGAVCFRDSDGRADDEIIAAAQEMIRTDPNASVELHHDEFGFTWLEVVRPTGDVSGLVTDLHAVNSTMAEQGFDTSLLCSTVVFELEGRRLALVYLFKRGTFYPFVPDPSAARRRDNPVELQIRALVERDIPMEADLGRWLAIWGAPRTLTAGGYLGGVTLDSLSRDQLEALLAEQQQAYTALQQADLKLDITRGKPSAAQLDLSGDLLTRPLEDTKSDGVDVRNYGGGTGLPALRSIFAELLGIPVDQLVAGNNASLSMMHDSLVFALLHGTPEGATPWKDGAVKFLCPAPGYDRHFAICEHLGIEMITIDMLEDGPDMAAVREHVADPAVKGMWLVPTYSNPTGAVVSDEVAAELAALETAAPDFRIMWDNAYAVHDLTDEHVKSADILGLCAAGGNPNRALVFASTSKVTLAGSGVSFLGGSPENVAWYLSHTAFRTIGPDKVNQARHAQFLGSPQGVLDLMARHREILVPKFETVQRILSERLGPHGVATWTSPKGGYFVNLDVVDGTASRVVRLAKEAGIALTPAGASFPYGKDPRDRNIRIAPSFPPLDELARAMEGLATCVLLAAAEKALAA